MLNGWALEFLLELSDLACNSIDLRTFEVGCMCTLDFLRNFPQPDKLAACDNGGKFVDFGTMTSHVG